MQATPNLIQGELHAIDKKCLPGSHRYSKQFVVKVARQLEQLYPEYDVSLAETEENYILRVKEYDKDNKG